MPCMVNFDAQRSPKVKSEVAPFLKITLMMCRNHVPSFILLSQNAQLGAKSALLNEEPSRWIFFYKG